MSGFGQMPPTLSDLDIVLLLVSPAQNQSQPECEPTVIMGVGATFKFD
jgi:hypothetical protein